MISKRVDLKWSLWSADPDYWEEHDGGEVLAAMRAALAGGDVVEVVTAPRKEIKFGRVLVGEGRANVSFRSEWDSISDLLGELGEDTASVEMATEWFLDQGLLLYGEPCGAHVQEQIQARCLEDLLARVDELEERLDKEDRATAERFARFRLELDRHYVEREKEREA